MALSRNFSKGKKGNYRRVKQEDLHRVNERITMQEIRLVGDNVEAGVYALPKALQIARTQDLDLVEINPKTNPPICRILEYKKFLYEQKKKQKQLKAKQEKVITKEIRLGPQTGDHDREFKIKSAERFLKSKEKVKFSIFFKGRSIVYKEQGELLLLKCAEALDDCGKVEQMPVMEGKRMLMVMAPKKK
ncbi:MAG: translation initiation factor IF-3 [Flavobacteriales bacterium AspAUS03]